MSIAFKRDILNALTSAVTYRVVALDLTELQLNYKTEYELHQLVNEQLAGIFDGYQIDRNKGKLFLMWPSHLSQVEIDDFTKKLKGVRGKVKRK